MKLNTFTISLASCLLLNLVKAETTQEASASSAERAPATSIFDREWSIMPDFLKPKKDDANDASSLVKDDFRVDFADIVKENGYEFEDHTINTEDGYVIRTFRVKK